MKLADTRIQLTLFADEVAAATIEKIRCAFNPAQYELIKCHVTLCREDEPEQIEQVLHNLAASDYPCINIGFGPAVRFADGKGVLLPATGANEQFHQLRAVILRGVIQNPRKHELHITLMHPRNSTCTNSIFAQIEKIELPAELTFGKISLIEQEGNGRWTVLKEFALKKAHCPSRKIALNSNIFLQ
jgi:2'-5' RNA ligase superfamily